MARPKRHLAIARKEITIDDLLQATMKMVWDATRGIRDPKSLMDLYRTSYRKIRGDIEQSLALGTEKGLVACKKGCSACCSLAVESTVPDVWILWSHIRGLPQDQIDDLTRRLLAARDATKDRDVEDWHLAEVFCPFLEEGGVCGVYDHRPLACAAHSSPDPAPCSGGPDVIVKSLATPKVVASGFSEGWNEVLTASGVESRWVRLVDALARVLDDPTAYTRWLAGEAVFEGIEDLGDQMPGKG